MIIACPACGTRYVVPDSALGVDGRTVRCAKCRHSWHQDGPEQAPGPPANRVTPTAVASVPSPAPAAGRNPAPAPIPAPPVQQTRPPAATEHDDPPPVPQERPSPPPHVPLPPRDAGPSQFDAAPPFRRRRNPLKLWTIAAGAFALLAAGTIVAVSYFGVPDWVPFTRPIFAAQKDSLRLDFPQDRQVTRPQADGGTYFGVSGTVTNIGGEAQDIPPIRVVLRDRRERIVYEKVLYPPQRSLAPGETVTINQAIADVPRASAFADIGWMPD